MKVHAPFYSSQLLFQANIVILLKIISLHHSTRLTYHLDYVILLFLQYDFSIIVSFMGLRPVVELSNGNGKDKHFSISLSG